MATHEGAEHHTKTAEHHEHAAKHQKERLGIMRKADIKRRAITRTSLMGINSMLNSVSAAI